MGVSLFSISEGASGGGRGPQEGCERVETSGERGPDTIALPGAAAQPEPATCSPLHYRLGPDDWMTAIHRTWAPGDSGPGGRCSRCPTCTSDGVQCHFLVRAYIPEGAPARDFGLRKLANPVWHGPGPGRSG